MSASGVPTACPRPGWVRGLAIGIAVLLVSAPAAASELSSGLTLLRMYGPRAAALGGAFTAAQNDVGGVPFNPASLASLEGSQASLAFERGVSEDTFSQVQSGFAAGRFVLGASVGVLDAGDIEYYDDDFSLRTAQAQRDVVASLSLARRFGRFSLGGSAKYLSSELIEQVSAQTYALDLGAGVAIGSRLHVAASALNLAGALRYDAEENRLPRTLRAGGVYRLPFRLSTLLFVDGLYLLNERESRQAAGFEFDFGFVQVRAGYRTGNDVEDFSLGMGIDLGRTALDYSFGAAQDLESRHQVAFSYRFETKAASQASVLKRSLEQRRQRAADSRIPLNGRPEVQKFLQERE